MTPPDTTQLVSHPNSETIAAALSRDVLAGGWKHLAVCLQGHMGAQRIGPRPMRGEQLGRKMAAGSGIGREPVLCPGR
jgi:hypothetical protein